MKVRTQLSKLVNNKTTKSINKHETTARQVCHLSVSANIRSLFSPIFFLLISSYLYRFDFREYANFFFVCTVRRIKIYVMWNNFVKLLNDLVLAWFVFFFLFYFDYIQFINAFIHTQPSHLINAHIWCVNNVRHFKSILYTSIFSIHLHLNRLPRF